MNRKGVSLWLVMLLILSSLIVIDFYTNITKIVNADILYVDDSNPGPGDGTPGNPFKTIQAGVDNAIPGDTVFVFNGTYYENVVVDKTLNLTGTSPNNTTINGGGSWDTILIVANWVNITGFTIINCGYSGLDAGIKLDNVHYCKIYKNNITSNNARGISLSSSTNINIKSNNITWNTEHGIHIDSSSNNNITGNNVSMNNYHGIYIYSSDGNILKDNILLSNNQDGIYILSSNNNVMENNNITFNKYFGIRLSTSTENNFISNCMFKNSIVIYGDQVEQWNTHNIDPSNTVNGKPVYYLKNQTSGNAPLGGGQIILANCTNMNITNHEITYGSIGIELGFCFNNNITGNIFKNNFQSGIRILFSNWNNIRENIIESNNHNGIYITLSENNTIENNSISSNYEDGIESHQCVNNIYTANFISNHVWGIVAHMSRWNEFINNTLKNNKMGVHLGSHSKYNNISGNLILSCWLGISLDSSPWNLVFENIITNSSYYGIRVYSTSYSNKIFHNDFLKNKNQAFDATNNGNYWDDGYPSGGNYWTDYDGIDLNTTPNQDIPPPDGIGDTSYIIDPDSIDNYPFMEPKEILSLSFLPPTLYINVSPNGKDVILSWDPPLNQDFDPYLIYRSTDPTNFNFNNPWVNTLTDKEPYESAPIPDRTMWNDTNAAFPSNITNYKEQYYYVIRAFNGQGDITATSRTVGKWTKVFPKGVSTFSLPLEPIEPLYTNYLTYNMNADYIKYIDPINHTWIQHNSGDGNTNNTQMKLGEGYEIKLSNQINHTFTGLSGSMISYNNDTDFTGFNSSSEAKNLMVSIESNGDINLSWQEPAAMGPGSWYEVYYSHTRDGFLGIVSVDYFLACPRISYGTYSTIIKGLGANNPGTRLYFIVVPFNISGIKGTSTYSIGIWTEEYLAQYDTFGIPLRLKNNQTADWYCDNIPDTVGINYYDINIQGWCWHSTRMSKGAYDPILELTEGYQISTSNVTKFSFIGV